MSPRQTPPVHEEPMQTAAHLHAGKFRVDVAKFREKLGISIGGQVRRRTPWDMLHGNHGFRGYFIGSVTSDFGTWLQNSAQVLLAYQLAHSVFTVGLVTFAQFTSPLLLGPWAGVAADKFGSRRTLLATQVVSAVVAASLAAFALCGALTAWDLALGALASGLAFTFALPARNVTVQRLVPRDKLQPAYAMDTVSYNLGASGSASRDRRPGPSRDEPGLGVCGQRALLHYLQRDLASGSPTRRARAGGALPRPRRLPHRLQRPPDPAAAPHGGRGHPGR